MLQQVTEKEHQNLLKQYKGTDRRYRLKVIELNRLYRSFNCTPIGLSRFAKILSDTTKQRNPLVVLKYLILIHGTIQFNYYSDQHLQSLLQFNLNPAIESSDKMQQWLIQVIQGYFKYLSKISFHGDIYQRSQTLKYKSSECLVDFFMILNQLNAYAHQSKGVFNCAGRYYFQKLFQIEDFFDILQNQYTNLYLLLRSIALDILRRYEEFKNEELESFVESFTELDNINDSLEDMLRNKHYQKALRIQFVELKEEEELNIVSLILRREKEIKDQMEMAEGQDGQGNFLVDTSIIHH